MLSDGEATGLITYMRTDGLHVSISFLNDFLSAAWLFYLLLYLLYTRSLWGQLSCFILLLSLNSFRFFLR